jgi:hypothetical protein
VFDSSAFTPSGEKGSAHVEDVLLLAVEAAVVERQPFRSDGDLIDHLEGHAAVRWDDAVLEQWAGEERQRFLVDADLILAIEKLELLAGLELDAVAGRADDRQVQDEVPLPPRGAPPSPAPRSGPPVPQRGASPHPES